MGLSARIVLSAVFSGAVVVGLPVSSQVDHPPVSFDEHIRPILARHCSECHARGRSKGDFSLESRDSMLAHETAVVPGDATKSRLFELASGMDPLLVMPPEGARLTDDEIALLRLWIDQGADWDGAPRLGVSEYTPPLLPRRPEVPSSEDPMLSNPIDRILEGYFADQGVTPNPIADDATYFRRVWLDLIGLLPPVDDLRAFVNDNNPQKHELAVRSLLSMNRAYTEHWLSFWNDHLRNDYAGPGYIDGGRTQITQWLYESLYDNKPYDQFVAELINPSAPSAGFANGIKWRGDVNTSQRTEMQFAQNVAQVFMGVNLKCASCHDSFIDGWKLRDSYALAAVIASEPLELHRCDIPTGEIAVPGFMFPELGVIDPEAPRGERLKQLALLMVAEQNGRLSRTVVNRLWARLMGRGIVEPVDVMSNRPWCEDLLDYLASDLVDHGYDLKRTLSLITTSRSYRRVATTAHVGVDQPFRGPDVKRMTAEQLVDAMWTITQAGPTKPDVQIRASGDSTADVGPSVRAAMVNASTLMIALGRPNREQVVTTRPSAVTTLEALELTNGLELARALARSGEILSARAGESVDTLIEDMFLRLLSREPRAEERSVALEVLGEEASPQSTADLLWIVMMLPEFQLIQ